MVTGLLTCKTAQEEGCVVTYPLTCKTVQEGKQAVWQHTYSPVKQHRKVRGLCGNIFTYL